jgi:hypothetical protein
VHGHVVPGVDHGGDLGPGGCGQDAAEEPGAADASGEYDYVHSTMVPDRHMCTDHPVRSSTIFTKHIRPDGQMVL